nr:hypothetical protein [Tanacetum cinerariifolium]
MHKITNAPRSPNAVTIKGKSSAQHKSTVIRIRIPPRRHDPETPIPTVAEIDVTNLHVVIQMSIATQRSLEDFKDKKNVEMVQEHLEDQGIEPRNDKESLKAETDVDMVLDNTNEEEEESAGDEKNFKELSKMLYQALKEMLPLMVNKEVNKIAKMAILVYVAGGLLSKRQKYKDDIAIMIAKAIQKECQILYAEVIS